jgi:hypothetical protein
MYKVKLLELRHCRIETMHESKELRNILGFCYME